MIKYLRISLLLAFTSSVWIGCSNEPNVADPPDPVEMSVTVWPEDGATDVAIEVKPTYTFSHELNNELPEITVSKQGSGEEITLTVVKVSSTVYRIEFNNLLDELATYDMYLHSAKGKNGEVLSEPIPKKSSFTTEEITVPALILSVIFPINNSEISDTVSTLSYQSNYDLNPATVEPSFTLTNTTTSTQLNTIIDVSGKDIYVNVDGLLEPGSSYTAEFDPDIIRGLNGEKPSTAYIFTFTTEAVYVQPPFTTPEGFLQTAGDFYDGKFYIGGYGPNDEGFTACFNWEGDSVWFNDFRINGQYTRITLVEVNSTGIYSVALVNPSNPVTSEAWLYYQSFDGNYISQWQLTAGGGGLSITSSENEIYINYLDNQTNKTYVHRYSVNGLQAEISYFRAYGILYQDGYLYVSGAGTNHSRVFLSKWHSDLSDSVWYNEVQHNGITNVPKSYITYASNRLWILAHEYNQQLVSSLIMQQYDQDGTVLRDITFPSSIGTISGVCSDGINAYKKGNSGLYKIYLDGNITHLLSIQAEDIFRANDPSGSNHKIAISDHTNELKFYNR